MAAVVDPTSDWKADLLAKPCICTRKGIAFGHNPLLEDTDVVILTALSGKFVDIRLPKPQFQNPAHSSINEHPSFWAFSGVNSASFYDPADGDEKSHPGLTYTAHNMFKHEIDSKGPGVVDRGDCFLLPDGDTVEVGIWHETGELYKEVWTGIPPQDGEKEVALSPVVVAETVGEAGNGRGALIRIGDYVQGVYERENGEAGQRDFVFCRWIRDLEGNTSMNGTNGTNGSKAGEAGQMWKIDDRSTSTGSTHFPVERLMEGFDKLSLGLEWSLGKDTWKVTELTT